MTHPTSLSFANEYSFIFAFHSLIRCRASTHLFSIRSLLAARHGRIRDLTLCLGSFTEANELNDEMMTIGECIKKIGLEGRGKGDPDGPVKVKIYYDFKPEEAGPILLDWK